MKKMFKKQKGITMITLAITIIILIILLNTVVYRSLLSIQLTKSERLQADIEMLKDKVINYYAQYGDFPANKDYEYTNTDSLKSILGKNDTGKFYVLNLSALENLTLNYGKEFEEYKKIIESAEDNKETKKTEINQISDIYIINETSLNIFYVQGIKVDDMIYYTNYSENDKDTIKVPPKCIFKSEVENDSIKVVVSMTNAKNTNTPKYKFKLLNEDDSLNQDWTETQESPEYIFDNLEQGKSYKVNVTAIIEEEEIKALNNGFLISLETKGFNVADAIKNGLEVGDFISYDAGVWKNEDMEGISVYPDKSDALAGEALQFGGFELGDSRNESAVPYEEEGSYNNYNYVKTDEEGNESIKGWRVFDIDEDLNNRITLISAGNPENYYHGWDGYISEYILTGDLSRNIDTMSYTPRKFNMYENNVYAQPGSAAVLTIPKLKDWYNKYLGVNIDDDDMDTSHKAFQEIYNNQKYYKYQTLVDNYSEYWFGTANDNDREVLQVIIPSERYLTQGSNVPLGIRILVDLKEDILLEKAGTKKIYNSRDEYGPEYLEHSVWDIVEN